jgi:dihydroorotase
MIRRVMVSELTIPRPDDWHLHLRDGQGMADVVAHSARRFARAVVMPNLKPPVTTVAAARAYRDRIMAAMPDGSDFCPLMTLYLTDQTPVVEIERAAADEDVVAVKLYPSGATTNSESGVTDPDRVVPVLEAMAELDLPLLVHGESTAAGVDVFDREAVFIEEVLEPLLQRVPGLRVVFEHITTAEAVSWVLTAPRGIAATITPHHLLLDRNAIFDGGLSPHHYCLPVLKRSRHREALRWAATSGNPRFFLGTDSAPHPRRDKEAPRGCAGIFSAHAAVELYAEIFDSKGSLDTLEGFACRFGAEFYGRPINRRRLTLRREPWTVPDSYPFGDDEVVPLRAGETVHWTVIEVEAPP